MTMLLSAAALAAGVVGSTAASASAGEPDYSGNGFAWIYSGQNFTGTEGSYYKSNTGTAFLPFHPHSVINHSGYKDLCGFGYNWGSYKFRNGYSYSYVGSPFDDASNPFTLMSWFKYSSTGIPSC
jgi:hypothetical protein